MISLFAAAALMIAAPVEIAPVPVGGAVKRDLPAVGPAKKPLADVSVTLSCAVGPDNRAEDCRVIRDSHPGLGFADAALALIEGETSDAPAGAASFVRTIQFLP
ncbi:hypothetical protein [Brevundimonas lutea]|uniref:hypothetical protein n=1 Tax=Brevundimonas lutea TaxID=2293980 RepID=UPI0013CEA7F9|nr:hypothetical protein [Brevundimonas lutea]